VLTHRDPWLCASLPILIGTEPQIILQEIPDTILKNESIPKLPRP
jgi:hypothetical protein